MSTATLTLAVIALGLLLYAWRRGDGSVRRGIDQGYRTFRRTALLLLVAFVIAGYVDVLSPRQLVQEWIGPSSGWRGLLLAELLGMLLPGGPYVVFPLIAALHSAGAGIAPVVTLVTSWATQALVSLSFELPFMGWRFAAVRWGLGILLPLMAGCTAVLLAGR